MPVSESLVSFLMSIDNFEAYQDCNKNTSFNCSEAIVQLNRNESKFSQFKLNMFVWNECYANLILNQTRKQCRNGRCEEQYAHIDNYFCVLYDKPNIS